MFSEHSTISSRRQPRITGASVAIHGLFLVWLLHAPQPVYIAPSSVAYGNGGSTITELYWPTAASKPNATGQTRAADSSPRITQARITWQRWQKDRNQEQRDRARSLEEAAAVTGTSAEPGESVSAGARYGSVGSNALSGDEIRPALPVRSSDPIVSSADLAGIVEGDVVVEITIDDKGNIIQKTVLKTLSPAVDAKVLAALENWRFRPATKNGVAIPSKQDVYYHFKGSNG